MHGSELAQASFETVFRESTSISETHNPTQAGPPGRFLDPWEGLDLPPHAQRKVAIYLLAITLLSDTNRVDSGHFEYWRCTGAFASRFLEEIENRRKHIELSERGGNFTKEEIVKLHGWTVEHPFDEVDIHELCLLIQLGLLSSNKEERLENITYIPWKKVATYSFQIASRFGLPVLEDLSDRMSERGSRIQKNLRYWFEETENRETARVLLEFNRLGDVDTSSSTSVVSQIHETVDQNDLRDRSGQIRGDGLIRKLHHIRGGVAHGDLGRGVAVIAITLCCLVFWDSLYQDQYTAIKDRLAFDYAFGISESEQTSRQNTWHPYDFYTL
ncbi:MULTISPECIES: hypothetical protein [unclassified Haloferax]|uniref:hypothetical protein n=1 Tax=unclassified Haloferax TaxID=2625095 RepID=UPI0011C05A46|nr:MULTISPECIES: hypothetical protein [unclassified Haloferax]